MKTKVIKINDVEYEICTTCRRYGSGQFYTWLNKITNLSTLEVFNEVLDPWNSNRIPEKDLMQLLP